MDCVVCGNKTGFFSSSKTYDGRICNNCRAYIPSEVCLASADADRLKEFYKESNRRKALFFNTASYGSLYIDSVHNMLCISNKSKRGYPLRYGNIYFVSELSEMALYCSDVVQKSPYRIECRVKLRISADSFSGEFVVASNEKCCFKRVDKDTLRVSEPSKVTFFRCMLNQMIDNERVGLTKQLEALHKLKSALSEAEASKEWAKGILFLESNVPCSLEDVKHQRNMLVRIFHPDLNTDFSNAEITAQINKAYEALMRK